MSGKLLDTNVVINYIKGSDFAEKILQNSGNDCCESAITVGELMFGAKKIKTV